MTEINTELNKVTFDQLTPTQRAMLRQQFDPFKLAHSKLMSYAVMQFPNYIISAHNRVIAEHLQKVDSGEITRLMIFMPPRAGKTMLVSEYFPAWYLGRHPNREVIVSTYSFDRANDIGRKVRNQLLDPMYGEIFQNCQISEDSKGANKFSTMQGGNYFSVGIGGGITGRGANLFIVDDPIKGREDADSAVAQKKLRDWFTSVAYTRLMPTNAIILVMTRWSFYDLAGFLLEEKAHENWTVLNLPAVAEDDDDAIGRKMGDALWPEQYPLPRLRQIKETIGTRDWNALYQQRPVPEEGGMVKLKWFEECRYSWEDLDQLIAATQARLKPRPGYKSPDPTVRKAVARMHGLKGDPASSNGFDQIVCSWDTAFKESQLNDPSSCTVWGVTKNKFYLLYVINERLEFPDLVKRVIRQFEYNKKKFNLPNARCPVLVEDKASGQSLIQELKRYTQIPVIKVKPETNKEVRLSEVTVMMEAGKVWLPERARWLVDYETQLCQFPYAKHDDMVDSTSQFLRWVGKPHRRRNPKLRYWK